METNKTTPNTSKQDIAADPFLAEMQSQLTRQSGSISSASTNIEKAISESISNLQKSNASTTKATTSAFDRQIDQTRKSGSFAFTGAQEEQRGFAQNVGILRKINEDTNTNLKDLEQRKQEVILQGDAATASKIADLQLKALEFKQQSEQQVFSNLLSMSNFGLSLKQEERQSKAQDFTEKNAISQIALEFGIPFSENDTIDSIITKAAPFASEDRQLKLQQIRADIQRSQAETAKALQGESTRDPAAQRAVAWAAYQNPDVFNGLSGDVFDQSIGFFSEFDTTAKMELNSFVNSYKADNPKATPSQVKAAIESFPKNYPAHVVNDVIANQTSKTTSQPKAQSNKSAFQIPREDPFKSLKSTQSTKSNSSPFSSLKSNNNSFDALFGNFKF